MPQLNLPTARARREPEGAKTLKHAVFKIIFTLFAADGLKVLAGHKAPLVEVRSEAESICFLGKVCSSPPHQDELRNRVKCEAEFLERLA